MQSKLKGPQQHSGTCFINHCCTRLRNFQSSVLSHLGLHFHGACVVFAGSCPPGFILTTSDFLLCDLFHLGSGLFFNLLFNRQITSLRVLCYELRVLRSVLLHMQA